MCVLSIKVPIRKKSANLFNDPHNWWTKYFVHPKIWRPKPCLLIFASLVALDGFHLLLSIQLTANLTLEWSVSSIVIYLCKNSFLLCWNSCKQCSELLMCCCFWSTVSKHSTYFEYSFFTDKCSCKMMNTLSSDIFNSSAISHNFNLWSAKTSFFVFSGTTAEFGWPEHLASFVSIQQCLKSAYHFLTIVFNGAESE